MAYPELALASWRRTRDTLHGYCRLLGAIRGGCSPRQRHWGHISLQVAADGFTTGLIPTADTAFELRLSLIEHGLLVVTSGGEQRQLALTGQSQVALLREIMTELAGLGVRPALDPAGLSEASPGEWDRDALGRFWSALIQISGVFQEFKGRQRQETSPVQFFPHHFDLALSWYSGRLVPEQDPADEEWSDELMNFGFSTGDEGLTDPYFYATAYPEPEGFVGANLPAEGHWQTQGFSGAVLPYASLVKEQHPNLLLEQFLSMAHAAGFSRMVG